MKSHGFLALLLLCGVLLTGGGGNLAAESQVDIGLNVPFYVGLRDASGDVGEFAQYAFLLPDVKANYFFEAGPVKVGGGVRLWTVILESVVYPIASAELDLGPVLLNANLGGGVFLFFGLVTDIAAESIFLPEVSAAYQFSDNFSAGVGSLLLFAPEVADLDSFAYVGTLFARFTF